VIACVVRRHSSSQGEEKLWQYPFLNYTLLYIMLLGFASKISTAKRDGGILFEPGGSFLSL